MSTPIEETDMQNRGYANKTCMKGRHCFRSSAVEALPSISLSIVLFSWTTFFLGLIIYYEKGKAFVHEEKASKI